MRRHEILAAASTLLMTSLGLAAAENLKLNPRLDYSSDSQDGPLISGDQMQDGTVQGKPNYVIIVGEG